MMEYRRKIGYGILFFNLLRLSLWMGEAKCFYSYPVDKENYFLPVLHGTPFSLPNINPPVILEQEPDPPIPSPYIEAVKKSLYSYSKYRRGSSAYFFNRVVFDEFIPFNKGLMYGKVTGIVPDFILNLVLRREGINDFYRGIENLTNFRIEDFRPSEDYNPHCKSDNTCEFIGSFSKIKIKFLNPDPLFGWKTIEYNFYPDKNDNSSYFYWEKYSTIKKVIKEDPQAEPEFRYYVESVENTTEYEVGFEGYKEKYLSQFPEVLSLPPRIYRFQKFSFPCKEVCNFEEIILQPVSKDGKTILAPIEQASITFSGPDKFTINRPEGKEEISLTPRGYILTAGDKEKKTLTVNTSTIVGEGDIVSLEYKKNSKVEENILITPVNYFVDGRELRGYRISIENLSTKKNNYFEVIAPQYELYDFSLANAWFFEYTNKDFKGQPILAKKIRNIVVEIPGLTTRSVEYEILIAENKGDKFEIMKNPLFIRGEKSQSGNSGSTVISYTPIEEPGLPEFLKNEKLMPLTTSQERIDLASLLGEFAQKRQGQGEYSQLKELQKLAVLFSNESFLNATNVSIGFDEQQSIGIHIGDRYKIEKKIAITLIIPSDVLSKFKQATSAEAKIKTLLDNISKLTITNIRDWSPRFWQPILVPHIFSYESSLSYKIKYNASLSGTREAVDWESFPIQEWMDKSSKKLYFEEVMEIMSEATGYKIMSDYYDKDGQLTFSRVKTFIIPPSTGIENLMPLTAKFLQILDTHSGSDYLEKFKNGEEVRIETLYEIREKLARPYLIHWGDTIQLLSDIWKELIEVVIKELKIYNIPYEYKNGILTINPSS